MSRSGNPPDAEGWASFTGSVIPSWMSAFPCFSGVADLYRFISRSTEAAANFHFGKWINGSSPPIRAFRRGRNVVFNVIHGANPFYGVLSIGGTVLDYQSGHVPPGDTSQDIFSFSKMSGLSGLPYFPRNQTELRTENQTRPPNPDNRPAPVRTRWGVYISSIYSPRVRAGWRCPGSVRKICRRLDDGTELTNENHSQLDVAVTAGHTFANSQTGRVCTGFGMRWV